jgi:hypothetical protein
LFSASRLHVVDGLSERPAAEGRRSGGKTENAVDGSTMKNYTMAAPCSTVLIRM